MCTPQAGGDATVRWKTLPLSVPQLHFFIFKTEDFKSYQPISSVCTHTFWVFYLFLFYVYECFDGCLCNTCTQYLWRPEEGISSPGTGIKDGCQRPLGCWEENPCHLEGQPVLLTSEPSLPLPFIFFFFFFFMDLSLFTI